MLADGNETKAEWWPKIVRRGYAPLPRRPMIDDRDVWHAAVLMVKRYGDDAMVGAAARADQLTEDKAPADGEAVH